MTVVVHTTAVRCCSTCTPVASAASFDQHAHPSTTTAMHPTANSGRHSAAASMNDGDGCCCNPSARARIPRSAHVAADDPSIPYAQTRVNPCLSIHTDYPKNTSEPIRCQAGSGRAG
jgi:hypothetical protein